MNDLLVHAACIGRYLGLNEEPDRSSLGTEFRIRVDAGQERIGFLRACSYVSKVLTQEEYERFARNLGSCGLRIVPTYRSMTLRADSSHIGTCTLREFLYSFVHARERW
jgi:hypothetical protein